MTIELFYTIVYMDFLDEVLNIEETAFNEGFNEERRKVIEQTNKEAFENGVQNGYEVAREIARIRHFATGVAEIKQAARVTEKILNVEVNGNMSLEEIRQAYTELTGLYKHLLSVLKIKQTSGSTTEF